MKVLFLINQLLNTCGVTTHFYYLLNGLREESELDIYVICGGGNNMEKFKQLGVKLIVDEDFVMRREVVIDIQVLF